MKKTVLVALNQREEFEKIKNLENYDFIFKKKFSNDELEKANIILGSIDNSDITLCKNLKWYHLSSAGVPPFVNQFAKDNNIKITNSAGAYGLAVSEFMFASTLALLKNLPDYIKYQSEGMWKSAGAVKTFYNATVLILGAGDIGQEYAKRAKAFGSYTIGVKRNISKKLDFFDEIYSLNDLKEIIPKADIIFNILPATSSTNGIISKDIIDIMKPSSIFVNGGRGATVDENALINALLEDKIAGACLDVFEVEPLEDKSPIWNTKNLIITPHEAGGFSLPETYTRIINLTVKNFISYDKNGDFEKSVDLSEGY